jgi:glucosyl-3-phosphoglycerate synthase
MTLSPRARDWLVDRTWQSPQWTIADLLLARAGRTVSVVLPALNEERTVGGVVASVLPLVGSVVDECVVVDSGSTDDTVAVAAAAGARVVRRSDVLPDVPPLPGKGEVLWRSVAATSGDVLVFLDSDLVDPDPGFVGALLGPMLTVPDTHLVKGFYRRPLRLENEVTGETGGRVTELMARPLLAALRPELSAVVQPLGGEYAVSREFAESVPFAAGYGVEIGLLLDAYARYGLAGLAQVNLGIRKHRNRSLAQLGVMARQILGTALARCDVADQSAGSTGFTQFVQVAGEWLPDETEVLLADRPPLRDLLAEPTLGAGCRTAVPPSIP